MFVTYMNRRVILRTVPVVVAAAIALIALVMLIRRRDGFQEGSIRTTRFSTTSNPWGVAFTKDGQYLFVAGTELVVYRLRGRDQPTVVRTISFQSSVGSGRGLSLSPNGAVLAVGRAKHISFLSVESLTRGGGQPLIASVPVPALRTDKREPNAAEPTFSADGTRVACPIEYQRRVMIVNVDLALKGRGEGAIVGFIPAGSAPVGVSFFPGDRNYVAFTNQSDTSIPKFGDSCSGSLRIANFRTGKVENTIPVSPGCDAVRVVIGSRYMYVSSRSANKIIKIDRFDDKTKWAFPVGPNPVGMGLAKGNRLVVAASNRFSDAPGEINVLDTTTGKMIARIPGLKFPRGVVTSPDGLTAAVTYYSSGAVELVHL
jgi:DNA-binding beta-propeller fold protein YncE